MLDTSARAKYERQFSGADSLMTQWKQKYAVFAEKVRVNCADIPECGNNIHGLLRRSLRSLLAMTCGGMGERSNGLPRCTLFRSQ